MTCLTFIFMVQWFNGSIFYGITLCAPVFYSNIIIIIIIIIILEVKKQKRRVLVRNVELLNYCTTVNYCVKIYICLVCLVNKC